MGVKRTRITASTSAGKIRLAERRREALDYRRAGYSLQQIADQLDVSVGTIHADIKYGLRAIITPSAEDLLKLQLSRLEDLLSAVYGNAANGDLNSLETARRLISDICRLCGLYPDQSRGGLSLRAKINPLAELGERNTTTLEIMFVDPVPPLEELPPATPLALRPPTTPPRPLRGP
jgi:hypothetical protein